MRYSTAMALAMGCAWSMDINPLGKARGVGASDSQGLQPCHDLPATLVTCGSHCWPNCDAHTGGTYPNYFDFNHYIIIPEARTCYIDTIDYGRFDAFLSKHSKLNVTIDTYVAKDGVCVLDKKGQQLDSGSLEGDNYCQIFMQVEMDECDNCPDYQRRIEVYSNRDTGCGMEFYVEPEPQPEPEPEPEPEEPPTPTPEPGPEDSSVVLRYSALATAAAFVLFEF